MELYPATLVIYPEKIYDIVTEEECKELKPKVVYPVCDGYDGQHYNAIGPYQKSKGKQLYTMLMYYPTIEEDGIRLQDIGFLPPDTKEFFEFLEITNYIDSVTFMHPLYVEVQADGIPVSRSSYMINFYKDGRSFRFESKRK